MKRRLYLIQFILEAVLLASALNCAFRYCNLPDFVL